MANRLITPPNWNWSKKRTVQWNNDKCISEWILRFEFRGSDYGKQIEVPGYTYPGPNIPYRLPKDTAEAERDVNRSTIERTRLINVHQCLFSQAERDVSRGSDSGGFPVSPRDLTRSISVEGCLNYRPHSENLHSIARSFFDRQSQSEKSQPRRLVEKEVAVRAANLLESVIDADGSKAISLIDQLFVAQTHCEESRSGIALVAIWTVIEHFMSVDWTRIWKHRVCRTIVKKS